MHRTCRSSKRAHAPPAISISQTNLQLQPSPSSPTAPFTFCATSCARFSQAPPRPNLALSFITAKKHVHYELPLKRWDIRNLQHRWRPTTTLPAALQLTPSNRNGQKQLICVFTGSAIEVAKAISKSIGAKVRPMVPIIFPNIIPLLIIRPYGPRICTRLRVFGR